jgi:hypothetical protein
VGELSVTRERGEREVGAGMKSVYINEFIKARDKNEEAI